MKQTGTGLLMILAFSPLVAALAVEAQPAAKSKIGYLGDATAAAYKPLVESFGQGLRQLGYIEGQNLTLEYRWAQGRVERLADLAAELVRLKVDVMVTYGTPATRASSAMLARADEIIQ